MKSKKLSPQEQQIADAATIIAKAGMRAGCPVNQLVNFSLHDWIGQPKQLAMAAAARQCDYRCPECETNYLAGIPIIKGCKNCGPRFVGVGGARGGGKQVKSSELMQFWRRKRLKDSDSHVRFECMIKPADCIEIGDYLIGSKGLPVHVLHKTRPEIRQFYRFEFDDGTSLETSDNHNWTVFDLSKRAPGCRERGTFQTMVTTKWLSDQGLSYRNQSRFAIPLLAASVEPPNPEKPPLPPYTLGYWLGNGFRQGSYMTCHQDDATEISAYIAADIGSENVRIVDYKYGMSKGITISTRGWIQKLQKAGWPFIKTSTDGGKRSKTRKNFLDDKMYIEWRNWSASDRMLLLSGLIDSDGCCIDGHMEFDSKDIGLAMLVRSLLMSFGQKCTLPVMSKPKKEHWSDMYRVKCYPTIPLFRLKRKAEKISIKRELKQYRRYITKIEKCGFHEGICFSVDSADHLYIAGQDYILTHNSAWMIAQVTLDDCQRFPGLSFLYVRKSAKTLRAQMRKLLQKTCKPGTYNYREQVGEITFPNGSMVTIRHFKDESEIDNFLGEEYDGIAYEELTTLSEDKFKNLNSCLRTSKKGWRPRVYASWNWGGIGHQWCRKFFYDPFIQNRQIESRYILATVSDNRHNNPEYINDLQNFVGWKYQSWYLGNPDLAAGNFFSHYREDVHVYPCACPECKSEVTFVKSKGLVRCNQCDCEFNGVTFRDEDSVRWWGSMDYGSSHPNCFHLFGEDDHGNCFTVAEVHTVDLSISECSEEFKQCLSLHNLDVGDLEAVFSGHDVSKSDRKTNDDGSTIRTEYQENGINLTPITINRVNAFSQMQERLGNPDRGRMPTWFIHRSCGNLRSQIMTAQCDPKKPNDVLKCNADKETGEGGDDALEGCRTGITGAYSSLLTSIKPAQMGGYQSTIREVVPETVDVESFIVECERKDREENVV